MQPPSLIHHVTDATKCRYKQLPGECTDRNAGFSRKGEYCDAHGQWKIIILCQSATSYAENVGWHNQFLFF